MPPIAPPPSTWSDWELVYYGRWRLTATSVLFTALAVMFAALFFLALLLAAITSLRYFVLSAPLPSDAGATPWSDIFGPVGTHLALAALGIFFIIIFLFLLVAIVLPPPDPEVFALRPPSRLSAPRGLDPAVTNTFPKVVYSTVKGHRIREASLECAVCLNDFEDHDTLRLIPRCHHAFHPDCIDKWLASHVTCPVCRADLTSLPAGDSASQLAWASPYPPWVKATFEAAPPDGCASERSLREGWRERIQPPGLWNKNESSSFNNRNRTHDSGEIQRFSRSHSTGHSLIRPSEDTERFTLRLPAEVWKHLMDQPGPVLHLEGCSSQGYRSGGEGSS